MGDRGEGRCRERRYADHIFIQIYFRTHHFVVKFSKFSSLSSGKGALAPLTEILRTFVTFLHSGVAMGWAKSREPRSAGAPEYQVIF